MSIDGSQSANVSVAPLISRCSHAGKDPVEEIVEVSSEETQSESFRMGGLVTTHCWRTQIILDESPTRVSNIPEGEDEEAPFSSGSAGFIDFDFLVGEAILDLSSDQDDIGVIYRESEYVNISRATLAKPTREKGENIYKVVEIESSVSEAELLLTGGCLESRSTSISGCSGQKSKQINPHWDASL